MVAIKGGKAKRRKAGLARLILLTAVDNPDDKNPIFEPQQLEAFTKKSAKPQIRLAGVACDLNGLTDKIMDELAEADFVPTSED